MTEDQSPIVAFGLYAATCAMRARTGALARETLREPTERAIRASAFAALRFCSARGPKARA